MRRDWRRTKDAGTTIDATIDAITTETPASPEIGAKTAAGDGRMTEAGTDDEVGAGHEAERDGAAVVALGALHAEGVEAVEVVEDGSSKP